MEGGTDPEEVGAVTKFERVPQLKSAPQFRHATRLAVQPIVRFIEKGRYRKAVAVLGGLVPGPVL